MIHLITTNSDNGNISVLERVEGTRIDARNRAEELAMTGKAGATGTVCLFQLVGCVKSVTKPEWDNEGESE